MGVWKRYSTTSHPHRKNAAVKYLGDHGFVHDHSCMTKAELWKPDGREAVPVEIDNEEVRRVQEAEAKRIREAQVAAAKKAGWILHNSFLGTHQYLASKGFPEERVNIWEDEGVRKMAIPMRINGVLVGLQLIYQERDEYGEPKVKDDGSPLFIKRFLTGQRTQDAAFVMDCKGIHFLCEGYASAMTLRKVLAQIKVRYTIWCCFSAGNMLRIAKSLPGGFVICDHDTKIIPPHTVATGQRIAAEIGWPTWMSATPNFDINDEWLSVGLFRTSQPLGNLIRDVQRQQRVSRQ